MARRLALVFVLLASHVFAQAVAPATKTSTPSFPDPGRTPMSKENQKALGMEVAKEVYQKMPVLPDTSPETQYVRQLGARLVATIPAEVSWPFEFHVIPQKEINAFAIPGGQMFINVGTITAAKNESELAGVMGHEMAHVYMQHSAKQASKAQTTSAIAGIASAILSGTKLGAMGGGLVGQLGQMGIQIGAQGLMMKYSRSDEAQADSVGAIILYRSQYDPHGMVDFFRTMGGEGGAAPPVFFSSHPPAKSREQAIAKQIANWAPRNYIGASAEFDRIRQHAASLRTYTAEEIARGSNTGEWAAMNQKNGATIGASEEGGFPTRREAEAMEASRAPSLERILPTTRMVTANLGPLTMARPESWPVTLPEQRGQFVTIASPAGVTKSGVGYGVLLNRAPGPTDRRLSVDELTALLIRQLQEGNALKQLSRSERLMVGGIESRWTQLESPSPFPDARGNPQKELDLLVTVPRSDGSLIFMIFIAPQSDFARLQPVYERMIRSVRFR